MAWTFNAAAGTVRYVARRVSHISCFPQGHHELLCGLKSLWMPALCCFGTQRQAVLWLWEPTSTVGWEPCCLAWGLKDAGKEHL